MKTCFENLRTYIAENPPDFGDSDSVLTLLYAAMNGMTLREVDTVLDPVCAL